jgi:hypothetical protein
MRIDILDGAEKDLMNSIPKKYLSIRKIKQSFFHGEYVFFVTTVAVALNPLSPISAIT